VLAVVVRFQPMLRGRCVEMKEPHPGRSSNERSRLYQRYPPLGKQPQPQKWPNMAGSHVPGNDGADAI